MLPASAIEVLRCALKGQQLAPLTPDSLQIIDSLPHGSVQAVLDGVNSRNGSDRQRLLPAATLLRTVHAVK